MADLSDSELDAVADALHTGKLDANTLSPDKRASLKSQLTAYQARKSKPPERKAENIGEALTTNLPTQGIKQDIVRILPAVAGSIPGAIAGAQAGALGGSLLGPVGTLAGGAIGGIAGAGLGGMAGEAVRQAGSNIKAALSGPEKRYPIARVRDVLKNVGDAGNQMAEAETVGQALGPVAEVLKPAANKVISQFAQKLGGLSEYATNIFEKNTPTVMKYVRMGADKAKDAAVDLGKQVQDQVGSIVRDAGKQYRTIIKDMFSKGELKPVNLADATKDTIENIRSDFGYRQPGAKQSVERITDSSSETLFNKFSQLAGKLKNASPEQVYSFQRDLSNAVGDNLGKPVSAALMQLKREVENLLPDVGEANLVYREANQLWDKLRSLAKSDNPVGVINSAFRRQTNKSDALLKYATQRPELDKTLTELFAASAASEGAKVIRNIPPTGLLAAMTGAPVAAGMHAHSLPTAIGIAAGEMTATSPRLYSAMYDIANRAPAFLQSQLARTGVRATLPPAMQALQNQRQP